MKYPNSRILIFAKAPEPGYAKTRLIPAVGAQAAAGIYRELLRETVTMASTAGLAPVDCCCAPDVSHDFFQQLVTDHGIELYPQSGADLGVRMGRAASQALQTADSVILIGGDCPVLRIDYLQQALAWLEQGSDAVLGPAEDGGYVLLGLRKVVPELFSGIPWGSDSVLQLTRQRLRSLEWRWQELAPLWDLDRPEDLDRYRTLIASEY